MSIDIAYSSKISIFINNINKGHYFSSVFFKYPSFYGVLSHSIKLQNNKYYYISCHIVLFVQR